MANVYYCNDHLFGEFIPKSKPDTRIMTEMTAGAGYARLGPCNVQLVSVHPIGKNHQHRFYEFVLPTVEPVLKIPLVIDY